VSIAAALLQGGFPIVFLLLLVVDFLVITPILVQVLGRAARRNPNRPGGDDGGTGSGRRG